MQPQYFYSIEEALTSLFLFVRILPITLPVEITSVFPLDVRSTVLFEIEENNMEIGYSITKDGEFLEPMEIIEIKG